MASAWSTHVGPVRLSPLHSRGECKGIFFRGRQSGDPIGRSSHRRRGSRLPSGIMLRSCIVAILAAGCGAASPPVNPVAKPAPEVARGIPLDDIPEIIENHSFQSVIRFNDVAGELGVDFTSRNGASGERLMSEATGGGCAALDFDNDAHWDLYFVQSGRIETDDKSAGELDQLYRRSGSRFSECAQAAGVVAPQYGQGVSAADFDNDGFDDLFVTNIGANVLLHNLGDGTYELVSHGEVGLSEVWSSSAAWGDVDEDGDVDLYVCNYVDFDPHDPLDCRNSDGERIQCQPNQVPPVPDEFYDNSGDGGFRECATELGMTGDGNRALGVLVADLVGDRRPEIYVANDATANFLFVRRDDGTYRDEAYRYGCAVGSDGRAQASMGIACGDADRNGRLDLYLTHFEGEWNTLYSNRDEAGFVDVTGEMGAVQITLPWVGFGTVMADFDQDGDDELFIANGHIDDLGREGVLPMPQQLLSWEGGLWRETGEQAGLYFHQRLVGRGCSRCDIDGDSDDDLVVVHQNSPAAILRNDSTRGHWVELRFRGRWANRRGIGVRAHVIGSGGTIMQELTGGGSYCSSSEPGLRFGLGTHDSPVDILLEWPGGTRQRLEGLSVDRGYLIEERQGVNLGVVATDD